MNPPKDPFFWGVSNSSFQAEGEPQPSDWYAWTQSPDRISDGSNANQGTRFWREYEREFKIAQNSKMNAFRISIAWERVQPSKATWDELSLTHYQKMIDSMRAHGLEPFLTLHHFVLPLWLSEEGGYLSPSFPECFNHFVNFVATRLKGIRFWNTFNEPNVAPLTGYRVGWWPPGKVDEGKLELNAVAQIVRAHRLAYITLKEQSEDYQVSIAHHYRLFEPKHRFEPAQRLLAQQIDQIWNHNLIQSFLTGDINLSLPFSLKISDPKPKESPSKFLDYLGLNYYGRSVVGFGIKPPFIKIEEGPGQKTDLGWEIYPEGFYQALKTAYAKYELPIYVTENGLADGEDRLRPQFLKDHIASLEKARAEGVDIRSYFHWSLIDNFEWSFGLKPRFGLVERNHATGELKPRRSLKIYQNLIEKIGY